MELPQPPTSLLERIEAFLPRIQKANEDLEKTNSVPRIDAGLSQDNDEDCDNAKDNVQDKKGIKNGDDPKANDGGSPQIQLSFAVGEVKKDDENVFKALLSNDETGSLGSNENPLDTNAKPKTYGTTKTTETVVSEMLLQDHQSKNRKRKVGLIEELT